MAGLKMMLFVAFVMTFSIIGQVISYPSHLFDTGRRYSDLDEIATKCRRICRANNGVVQIEGDECRCRITTENPVESVDHVLERAGREGLNLVPRIYPRFKRSPCMGVLGMPIKNPTLMQQRLRAYGVGMLAPILGISPDQVNVLVGDIMKGNYRSPTVIGQQAPSMIIGQQIPDSTKLDVMQGSDNIKLATTGAATAIENMGDKNMYQDVVGSMIETVPFKKTASDMAIDGEPMLGVQRSIVPIVGGSQVPSTSIVNGGVESVDGPIVSPFKTR